MGTLHYENSCIECLNAFLILFIQSGNNQVSFYDYLHEPYNKLVGHYSII
jgi:hypothetical protein